MRSPLREPLLNRILSQPTAPYREHHVIQCVTTELDAHDVPWFRDPIGNLVLGAKNRAEYLRRLREKSTEPLRIFIAHLDHPGFHGVRWRSDSELEVKWYGGSPTQFLEGARVWLATREGSLGDATFTEAKLIESGRAIDSGVVRFTGSLTGASVRRRKPAEIYGGFGFRAPVWQEGRLLYTKAADDLVGAFAIVSLAIDKVRKSAPFLGLLTRAEEVGFIGAVGHLNLGWLKDARRPLLAVSLETSRTLPGAEIGKGPVVRLGDRATVFDAGALRVFSDLAQKRLPGRHQRRIMDGGSCEATAATAFGLDAIGISVPLGNYHNQDFEGGPDAAGSLGPAPEFVHLYDVEGLLELCDALTETGLPWAAPWKSRRLELIRELGKARALLKAGP